MVNKSRVFLDSATGCLTSTSNLDRSVVIHLISSYPVEPYLSVIRVYRHGPARGRRAVTSPSRGGRTSCRRPGTRGGPRPSSGRRARRGFSGAFRSEDGRSRAASTCSRREQSTGSPRSGSGRRRRRAADRRALRQTRVAPCGSQGPARKRGTIGGKSPVISRVVGRAGARQVQRRLLNPAPPHLVAIRQAQLALEDRDDATRDVERAEPARAASCQLPSSRRRGARTGDAARDRSRSGTSRTEARNRRWSTARRSRPRVARTSGSARFHPSVKDRHLACQRASATTLAAAGASASYSDKTFRSGHASASRTRTCGARGLSGHCLVGPLRRAALAAHPAGEGTRRPRPARG